MRREVRSQRADAWPSNLRGSAVLQPASGIARSGLKHRATAGSNPNGISCVVVDREIGDFGGHGVCLEIVPPAE